MDFDKKKFCGKFQKDGYYSPFLVHGKSHSCCCGESRIADLSEIIFLGMEYVEGNCMQNI